MVCRTLALRQEAENYAKYILPGPMLRQVAWQLLQALAHIHEHQVRVSNRVCARRVRVTGGLSGRVVSKPGRISESC